MKKKWEKIDARSGLPQGPFWENNLFPLKVGFGVQNGSKVERNHFIPTLNPFRDVREKNPLLSKFKGGE